MRGKVYREVRISYSLDFHCQHPDVAAHGDGLIYEGTLTIWLQQPQPLYLSDLRNVKRARWLGTESQAYTGQKGSTQNIWGRIKK